jgi:branched-chain amino acid aminotransferase
MFDTANFPNAKKIWYMGKILDWDDALVHSQSHALHYGTSVFEGIRAYSTARGPAVFRLDEHMDRFMHSAPWASPVELFVSAWEWGAYLGKKSVNGVRVYILPWKRIHHSQIHMGAKLGGSYVQSTFCGMIAREKGFDEAVFLNLEGNVAEGPGENILIVKDGIVKTNDRTESILEGITRTTVLQIAEDLGMQTEVGPMTKEDLFDADEVMFAGTAVEVVPIIRIADGSVPGEPEKEYVVGDGMPGPVTKQLRSAYLETVNGKQPRYDGWLTYVNE